jgi:hypothetical protein
MGLLPKALISLLNNLSVEGKKRMGDWTFKAAAVAVVAIVLSSLPLTIASAPPAPAVWLMPEKLDFYTNQKQVGDRFNVTVWISTTGPSYAWQIQINFSASQIKAVRADYTGQGKSMFFTGHDTVLVSPAIDNSTGVVMLGETLIGEDAAAAASGSVFWIEFEISAAPTEEEVLTSLISVESNPDITYILDFDLNNIADLSLGSAVYTLSPVRSEVWIVPETLDFYTNQKHVGDKFNVTVGVNATKASYAWQIQVNFSASQIKAVRADYTGQGKSMFFTGHDTIPVSAIVDNMTGSVMHGEVLIGIDQRAAGNNSLFWVEFMIVAEPAENETLTSLISIDSDPYLTFVLDPDLNKIQNLRLGSAAYNFGPTPPVRDVALTSLSLYPGQAKQGGNVTVTLVALNNGTVSETFDVSLAFDSSLIVVLNVAQLAAGDNTTVYYEWNTTGAGLGNHIITATATQAPHDLDPANNMKSRAIAIVTGTTDINGDGRVDMLDIAMVAHAFGTHEGDLRWIPAADISSVYMWIPDGAVDMFDVAMVAKDLWNY